MLIRFRRSLLRLSVLCLPTRMDLLKRGVQYGLADWVTTFIIAGLGLCAEKGLAPFEHELGPQLADPRISYPYTPNAQSHCPKSLLIALAFILPLVLIASTQLLAPSTLDLNHALLGMISSLSYTLLLVALIKAAVGRLRPDFLARCVLVDGACTGVPHEVTEGRKSAPRQPLEPSRCPSPAPQHSPVPRSLRGAGFPSGHTALAFASLSFVSFYWAAKLLHAPRLRHSGSLWRATLVAAPCVLALMIGLSRIADYWHHWEDVTVGSVLGTATAYTMYRLRFPPIAEGAEPLAALQAAPWALKSRSGDRLYDGEYPV